MGGRSFGKYAKVGVYMRIDDNLFQGVDRIFGSGVCRGVDGEVNIMVI